MLEPLSAATAARTAGYYTLSAAEVDRERITETERKKLARISSG